MTATGGLGGLLVLAGLIAGLWLRGVTERTSHRPIPAPFPQRNSLPSLPPRAVEGPPGGIMTTHRQLVVNSDRERGRGGAGEASTCPGHLSNAPAASQVP